jgi:hypothetical protein
MMPFWVDTQNKSIAPATRTESREYVKLVDVGSESTTASSRDQQAALESSMLTLSPRLWLTRIKVKHARFGAGYVLKPKE